MNNTPLTVLGSNVRARRLAVGISQERLAAKCGLHRTYIGSVERGERNIGLLNVVKIACALGVSPQILLAGISCEISPDEAGNRS